jgi:uncharacterized LabA/DUF88 family protein
MKRVIVYIGALTKHCSTVEIVKDYFAKARPCRHCQKKNNEEEQTDVNIACEIIQNCYESNFDIAYLVSGDSDLAMAVSKAVKFGKIIIITDSPNRQSKELNDIATNHFNINKNHLKHSQLPDQIPTKRNSLKRPNDAQ